MQVSNVSLPFAISGRLLENVLHQTKKEDNMRAVKQGIQHRREAKRIPGRYISSRRGYLRKINENDRLPYLFGLLRGVLKL